jgi:Fic-DOC domain mobile mystery protein B
MGLNFEYIPGQTPLEEEEKEELLISSITTRSELDEFEQYNISQAVEWTLSRKFDPDYVLSEWFVRELHRRMFSEVWGWAGTFRKSNKNIGVDKTQIAVSLNQLLENVRYWVAHLVYPHDEIAIRASHQIVSIHCFPNGNGRHSRLMADVIITHVFHKQLFSWGQSNLTEHGETRKIYISAIHEADNGNIKPLIEFARS